MKKRNLSILCPLVLLPLFVLPSMAAEVVPTGSDDSASEGSDGEGMGITDLVTGGQGVSDTPVDCVAEEDGIGLVVDRQCPCGTGAPDHILRGGRRDDFQAPLEAAVRRPELMVLSPGMLRSGFDDVSANRSFGHTLAFLPENIVRAVLELRMRAIAFPASNDSLYLGIETGRKFTFFWRIEDLPEVRGNWEMGHPPTDFLLDLGKLPDGTDLVPKMNAERVLDIKVQDDTMVDYVELTIWTCPRPVATGGAVIAEEAVRGGRSLLLDPQRDPVGRTEMKIGPAP